MRFIKLIMFFAFSFSALSIFAGEATVAGEGRISAKPDYVSLTLRVASECYRAPRDASAANDAKVAEVVHYMQTLVDLSEYSRDDVLANGGYTQPYERTVYPRGAESVTVCSGTFQKISTIVLKSTDVAGFGEVLAQIQEYAFADFQRISSDDEIPVTYMAINQPSPELFHETRSGKEKDALKAAKLDALEKFQTLIAGPCAVSHYQIVDISEPEGAMNSKSYASEPSSFAPGRGVNAPVLFDDHWINRAVNIKFYFEGGRCDSIPAIDLYYSK